jgi:hypothetical protein
MIKKTWESPDGDTVVEYTKVTPPQARYLKKCWKGTSPGIRIIRNTKKTVTVYESLVSPRGGVKLK